MTPRTYVGGHVQVRNLVRAQRSTAVWVAAAMVMVGLTGCGSRLTSEEIRAEGVVNSRSGSDESGDAVGVEIGDDAEAGADGELSDDGSSGGSGSTKRKGSTSGPVAANEGGGGGGGGGNKAPITIGYIGWLSGTGGETMSPTRDMWVAWSRAVNARGGINGHKVNLLIGDHGGVESRAVSLARDFVENKGAIALTTGSGGPAVGEYAKSKRIPVVGTIMTGGTWNANPYQFPPFGAAEASSWGAARLIKRTGKTKVASIYCAESSDCADGAERIKKYAAQEGIEIVSQQQYSVVGADYTAECIRMRGSGAQVVYPTGDTGSMIRMAKACSRQNFRPIWISPTMDDSVASVAEFENAIAVTPAFPWFLRSGNPGIDEMVAALRTYAPGRLTKSNLFMSQAWVSAKLFEKAAEKVGDKPTSQEILDALWSMKGETLGGLTAGRAARSFTRDQPTPETFCVFDTKLVRGKWTAPSGLTPICR
jgi:branched-chain amino acid transport system substrate-binding protein